MEVWLESKLSEVLGFPGTGDIAKYVISIEDPEDQCSYLSDMLDLDDRNHQAFLQDFRSRVQKSDNPTAGPKVGVDVGGVKLKSCNPLLKQTPSQVPVKKESSKKTKFVNLYSKEGVEKEVVMLKGRHPCDCQASKHALVNNCIRCGKIVCQQEGSGPCLFPGCSGLVCTKEEQEILDRGSKKSEQLRKKLMAESQKDKLLEFDRTSERRTRVIDDESDYFSVDAYKWMSEDQRKKLKKREEELHARKHESKLNRKIDFDFAGRRVVDNKRADLEIDLENDPVIREIIQQSAGESVPLTNPRLQFAPPKFMGDNWSGKVKDSQETKVRNRLQDKELQEMRDEGMCLTMHQPYASYLVKGIKIHEGRTWYSSFRGRLWIHAAAKVPSDQETADLQNFYRVHLKKEVAFPSLLPVSCLLGCVDVEDVLSQEEYREKYPDGESSSPYVFICRNPQELAVKFPMSGQHKIYKLDSKLHQAAVKSPKL